MGQQQESNDDDGDETTKPDVKLPKQKPFRVVTTPTTVRNQGKSCTTTTTTTLKDAEVMASMQTLDIALNAISFTAYWTKTCRRRRVQKNHIARYTEPL